MSDTSRTDAIRAILDGIDRTELDHDGWWETSTGAEFGAGKLADVVAEVAKLERENAELHAANVSLIEEWGKTKDRLRVFEDLHVKNLLGPLFRIGEELKAIHDSYTEASGTLTSARSAEQGG